MRLKKSISIVMVTPMLDYASFSALRLEEILDESDLVFALPNGVILPAMLGPEKDFLDERYAGGRWHGDEVNGVIVGYPEADNKKVGFVELTYQAAELPAFQSPNPQLGATPRHEKMRANASKVLEVLKLPIRFGDDQLKVSKLAHANKMDVLRLDNVHSSTLSFAHGERPERYWISAMVHDRLGLMNLEINRPDLVRRNRTRE